MAGKGRQMSLKGVVQSKTQIKESKAGSDFIKVFIRCDDHNLRCLMFLKELCVWAATDLQVGDFVTAHGSWNGEIMFVSTAEKLGKGVESQDKVIHHYGSFEGHKAAIARAKEYHELDGDVQVTMKLDGKPVKVWIRKDMAVFRDETWQGRIEYICDKLGDKYVSDKFRQFCKGDVKYLLKNKDAKAKYNSFVDELIAEADFV